MNHLLIGFAGLDRPGSPAICLFDTDTGHVRTLLEWPESANVSGGVQALATSDKYLFVAIEGQDQEIPPSLLVFDLRRFRLLGRDLLTGLRDVRSLLYLDGTLYIVSSGTNEVVAYRADQGRLTGQAFRWRPNPSGSSAEERPDLDSLAFFEGEVVVSGRRNPLDLGFLLSMTRGEPISQALDGLGQPGSLSVFRGSLISCEESTGTLRRLQDGFSKHLGGRLRGLGVIDDEIFVGSTTEAGCLLHRLDAESFRERSQYNLTPPSSPSARLSCLLPMDDVSQWPPDPDSSWAKIPGRPVD